MQLCRSLRWKSWYGTDAFSEAELVATFRSNEVPYTCLQTCQAWGPDDAPAVPERCDGTRSCFRPSRKLIDRSPPRA
jgi:hypothetical protein